MYVERMIHGVCCEGLISGSPPAPMSLRQLFFFFLFGIAPTVFPPGCWGECSVCGFGIRNLNELCDRVLLWNVRGCNADWGISQLDLVCRKFCRSIWDQYEVISYDCHIRTTGLDCECDMHYGAILASYLYNQPNVIVVNVPHQPNDQL